MAPRKGDQPWLRRHEQLDAKSAYVSGLVIGIELALMDAQVARKIADQIHIASATNTNGNCDEDARDDLYDQAQAYAKEVLDAARRDP